MKNKIKTRFRKLRNFIYDEKTREKCRLNDEKHKHTFTRNRKIPFYDILLMTLNKQGKNISFEKLSSLWSLKFSSILISTFSNLSFYVFIPYG